MRISEQSKQNISPRAFWLTIGAVTLLLGGMGIIFMQSGNMPHLPSWLWAGLLLFIWGSALLDLLRYGSRVFSRMRLVYILGGTMFALSHFVPYLGRAASWMENVGLLILMCINMGPMIEFGKRPPSAPPALP